MNVSSRLLRIFFLILKRFGIWKAENNWKWWKKTHQKNNNKRRSFEKIDDVLPLLFCCILFVSHKTKAEKTHVFHANKLEIILFIASAMSVVNIQALRYCCFSTGKFSTRKTFEAKKIVFKCCCFAVFNASEISIITFLSKKWKEWEK